MEGVALVNEKQTPRCAVGAVKSIQDNHRYPINVFKAKLKQSRAY